MFGHELTKAQKNLDCKNLHGPAGTGIRDMAKANGRDTVGSGTPYDILMTRTLLAENCTPITTTLLKIGGKVAGKVHAASTSRLAEESQVIRYAYGAQARRLPQVGLRAKRRAISATRSASSNPSGYNSKSSIQQPRYISDDATQDSINNTLAQGYANADEGSRLRTLIVQASLVARARNLWLLKRASSRCKRLPTQRQRSEHPTSG